MNKTNKKMLKMHITKRRKIFDSRYNTLEQVAFTLGFVDKSLLIKDFFDSKDVVLIMAPPGFGKTTNMDTLKQFLLGNWKPFESHSMKIYTENTQFFRLHCRKRPVIHVDFKSLDCTSHDTFLSSMKNILFNTFIEHEYLIQHKDGKYDWSDETLRRHLRFPVQFLMMYMCKETCDKLTTKNVIEALRTLSLVLWQHWAEKVIVLIDEYDAPIKQIISNKNVEGAELILSDFSAMVSQVFQDQNCVERALINTCFCLESYHPPFKRYPFLSHPTFSKYYGFTNEEVLELFDRIEFKQLRPTLEIVDKWYGGYECCNTTVYNNCSVLTYLAKSVECRKPVFVSYWLHSRYEYTLTELFAVSCIREKIEDLLNGCEVEVPMKGFMTIDDILMIKSLFELKRDTANEGSTQALIQFLTNCGYFSAKRVNNGAVLAVPNLEIKYELEQKCYDIGVCQRKYQLDFDKIEKYGNALENVAQSRNSDAFTDLKIAVQELFAVPAVLPRSDDEFRSILYTLAFCEDLYVAKVKGAEKLERLDFLVVEGSTGIIIQVRLDSETATGAHFRSFDFENCDGFESSACEQITHKVYIGLRLDKKRNVTMCVVV